MSVTNEDCTSNVGLDVLEECLNVPGQDVNLTNAALNIDSSNNVVIGHAYHYYNAPVTIQRASEIVVEANSENVNSSIAPEEDIGKSTTFNRKIVLFVCVFSLSSLSIIILIFLSSSPDDKYDQVSKKKTIERSNFNEVPKLSYDPHCKIIEEQDWGMKKDLHDIPLKIPVPLVIVSHSVTPFCRTPEECRSIVAEMQRYHISNGGPDIGYNFIIGGDANIYVGRGWYARNFHRGNHSIALNFVGNYFRDTLTPKMIACAKFVLEYGSNNGLLSEDYFIVCHNQTTNGGKGTSSPGPNACGEIKKWPHYKEGIIDWNFLYKR